MGKKQGHAENLVVDIASVADRYDHHQNFLVSDVSDNPIVADAISPQPLQISEESVTEAPWILGGRNSFAQVFLNLASGGVAEFSQLSRGVRIELNTPNRSIAHRASSASSFSRSSSGILLDLRASRRLA